MLAIGGGVLYVVFRMDAVGIHAIFGGFALEACMPRGLFADELKRKLEPLTVVLLLLPMFFTYSGLNTRMDTGMASPLVYGRRARASGELEALHAGASAG